MDKMRLENVYFAYGEEPVLQGLSLSLQEGRFSGIVGPNGAGKSTVLKLLDGYIKPQQGAVYLNGENLRTYSLAQLAQEIALIPQTSYYIPFTVQEMVLLGRTPFYSRLGAPSEQDRQIAQESMEITGVAHLAHRLVSDLSGGERQRVTIARAFAQQTKVLLLDEPTTHLDLEHQVNTCRLLKEKSREGVTVLAVLHDLNLAAAFCDYVFVLNGGVLMEEGSPGEVLTPELIAQVFRVSVPSLQHPLTGRPIIVP
ncbi:MAG TPA: ABC transporter ATP-binding protein [Firmicutes bacterium]|jgi:ABC-type cobalamin/Fe3+-siderophores transport system ATPase subunit|nr:ABC transporter ATP-binding protein [Bacillota bacterium]HHT43284.1 ABC transporter ATP-binding protein [Bacillota bacterium]